MVQMLCAPGYCASGAATRKSSYPSLSKSPPPPSAAPALSAAPPPCVMYAPIQGSRLPSHTTSLARSRRPYTTHAAPACESASPCRGAPTTTSLTPSPFKSEPPATAYPSQSPASTPRSKNPLLPPPVAKSPRSNLAPSASPPYTTYTSPALTAPAAAAS
eukprot:2298583-Rhodomonas_salina.3